MEENNYDRFWKSARVLRYCHLYLSFYLFTAQFFPEHIFGKNAVYLAWITFVLRYIARPIGGLVIGFYADKHGKKQALILIKLTDRVCNHRHGTSAGLSSNWYHCHDIILPHAAYPSLFLCW